MLSITKFLTQLFESKLDKKIQRGTRKRPNMTEIRDNKTTPLNTGAYDNTLAYTTKEKEKGALDICLQSIATCGP